MMMIIPFRHYSRTEEVRLDLMLIACLCRAVLEKSGTVEPLLTHAHAIAAHALGWFILSREMRWMASCVFSQGTFLTTGLAFRGLEGRD